MVKIGLFQLHVRDIAKKYKITNLEVCILLYGSENMMFTQYEIGKKVPASRPVVINSMRNLTESGWTRIVVERKPGVSRKYSITGKGRSLVTEFNFILGNL